MLSTRKNEEEGRSIQDNRRGERKLVEHTKNDTKLSQKSTVGKKVVKFPAPARAGYPTNLGILTIKSLRIRLRLAV
jgi:hypothetical protein